LKLDMKLDVVADTW